MAAKRFPSPAAAGMATFPKGRATENEARSKEIRKGTQPIREKVEK